MVSYFEHNSVLRNSSLHWHNVTQQWREYLASLSGLYAQLSLIARTYSSPTYMMSHDAMAANGKSKTL